MTLPVQAVELSQMTDEQLVARVLSGEAECFETILRRYNQRVYRAARAILRDDAEAEDVAQEAYVRAFQHLAQFEGRASLSTWLTRIAVHEALARLRRRSRTEEIDAMDGSHELRATTASPEQNASTVEVRHVLEQSIDSLPDSYRTVFVLRDVEEMSTDEAAQCLGISEENVRARLHRARAMLRRELYARAGAQSSAAFQFMGARCERLTRRVMQRIAGLLGPLVN